MLATHDPAGGVPRGGSGPNAGWQAGAARGERPAILVIDDDAGVRDTLRWALRAAGFEVALASTGAEARQHASSQSFDVVVLDLRLPDTLGTDLLRTLRERVEHVPFILVSGFLTVSVVVEAMRLGAFDVLEKPVDVECLLAVLRTALEQPRRVFPLAGDDSGGVRHGHGDHAMLRSPGSAAERWAQHVLAAFECERDVRTLGEWARCAGVSYSSLRENCRLLGIHPHDARDLARVLRALRRGQRDRCDPRRAARRRRPTNARGVARTRGSRWV